LVGEVISMVYSNLPSVSSRTPEKKLSGMQLLTGRNMIMAIINIAPNRI